MRLCVLLFCLLPATACLRNSPVEPTALDEQVVLAPGQTTDVAREVAVAFIGVIGDSRCPGDAICITGGDAIVRIAIIAGGARAERDLRTGPLAPVAFSGVRVRLVELQPYPFSSRPFDPSEYRATLRVSRD